MTQDSSPEIPTIVLVGPDAALLNGVAAALGPVQSVTAVVVAESIEQAARWMYYGGDLAELVLAVLLFAKWYRRGARAGTRATAVPRAAVI